MRDFIIGLSVSATLMIGLVYATVINPTLFVDITNVDTKLQNDTTAEEINQDIPEVMVDATDAEQIKKHLDKAQTLMTGEYFSLAMAEYQAILDIDPSHEEATYGLGKAAYAAESYELALQQFLLAANNATTESEANLMVGKTYLELKQFDQALSHFQSLQQTTNSAEALYYTAVLQAFYGNYDEASAIFNQVIEQGGAANLTQNANNYLETMAEFSLSQDVNPQFQQTLIARSLAETQEYSLALYLLYTVLADAEDYRDAWIIMGYIYLSKEQYQDAQEALLKAVELDPSKAESRYFLGLSYYGQEDYASAITQLELALASDYQPKLPLYQHLADAAVYVEDYEKAVAAYENVLVIDSSHVNRYIRPIWIHLDILNDTAKALELAETAITEHPNEAMAYSLLGWVETIQGDYRKAEENLNYALILNPDLAAAYLNLGRLYEMQEKWDEAEENYKRAYTLDANGSVGSLAAERYNTIVQQQSEAEAAATETETSHSENTQ
jgi:tetratricopeptide (TPR) repeat protein